MKIVYVTMQFPVASEAFAAVELRALQRLGAEVTVLSYRGAVANACAMLAERGLAGLEVDQGSVGSTASGLLLIFRRPGDSLFLFSTIFRSCWRHPLQLAKALVLVPRSLVLLERIEKLRPDLVHLFWGHYPSLLGLLVKRRLRGTHVSQFLGAYDLEQGFPPSALLAKQADTLVTHAKANLPAITALGVAPDRVRISYRGIEIPETRPQPEKTTGLIVVAERLVPQKHTADALRVFAELHRKQPGTCLLVLGDGPERERLKRLAETLGLGTAARFLGHMPHHEVFEHLSRAQAVITMSQSRSERLPNAIKEAMLHRCLCLATRTPGIDELIQDGETGLLVEPGAVSLAADRLAGVLSDPGEAERIGEQAKAQVIAHFNVDSIMSERLRRWTAAVDAKVTASP